MASDSQSHPDAPLPSPKRKRWKLRAAFSLRAMMLLVLVVGVWMGWRVNRARGVRRAIQIIEKAGGVVRFEGSYDAGNHRIARTGFAGWIGRNLGDEYVADVDAVLVQMQPESDVGEVIKAIVTVPRVKRLGLYSTRLSDEDVAAIAGMADLEEILIKDQVASGLQADIPPPSSAGMTQLARLRKLRSIDVTFGVPGVIDARSLRALATLPGLRILKISRLRLGDDEMAALGEFRHLEELCIWADRPFEDGLPQRPLPVASWGELRTLMLWSTWLSRDEIRAISRLENLEKLFADEIPGEHLPLLYGMKMLKFLCLNPSIPYTPESIAALRAALPRVVLSR